MIKKILKGFILQLQFLTRMPLPVHLRFDERVFAGGVVFAPLIGLFIGAVSAGMYLIAAGILGSRSLAVLIALTAEIAATGGLHLDGLADACDGLFSSRDREGILAIMKDSRLGTNGAVALIILILGKFLMIAAVPDSDIIKCLLIMPVLSRMTVAWSAGISPYAGKSREGPAPGLIGHIGVAGIVLTTIISMAISMLFFKFRAVILAMIIIAFTLLVNFYAKKKIGGITGDIIGAVIETSEAVFLLAVLVMEKV
ncbi:MAG: cobalamin 5'-phosphate synthase [Spirochaetes bacterium RBG_16_49_21]|nr:MAG: cobalamin 5'-phosphate synthase [Spirochaetes bacterium RBG_16_49_21]